MIVAGRHEALDIGRVAQRTFQVLGRNCLPFGGLAILLVGLPSLIVGLINMAHTKTPTMSPASVAEGAAFGLFSFFLSVLLQACIVIGSVADLKGNRPSIIESLRHTFKFILPVAAISILAGLGLGFGFMLLVVPGVILSTMWAVIIPAAVIEKAGVFEAFQRSRDLTRGNRWRIFALLAVYFVVAIILQWSLLRMMGFSLSMGAAAASRLTASIPELLISKAITVILTLVGAVGLASIYVELRAAGEGLDLDDVASVFA